MAVCDGNAFDAGGVFAIPDVVAAANDLTPFCSFGITRSGLSSSAVALDYDFVKTAGSLRDHRGNSHDSTLLAVFRERSRADFACRAMHSSGADRVDVR